MSERRLIYQILDSKAIEQCKLGAAIETVGVRIYDNGGLEGLLVIENEPQIIINHHAGLIRQIEREVFYKAIKIVGDKIEQLVNENRLTGDGVIVLAEMCGVTSITKKQEYSL